MSLKFSYSDYYTHWVAGYEWWKKHSLEFDRAFHVKFPPNLSGCHVKYSLLVVYNRVILSTKLAQFTCGLFNSLHSFSVQTNEVLFWAMSVYLLSALLFKCHTSETVSFTSDLWMYVAGLYLFQRRMSCQQPCVCGTVRNTDGDTPPFLLIQGNRHLCW